MVNIVKKPIIIVGTGMAGYATARELRRANEKVKLILLTSDDGASYSKPMLSTALSQGKSPQHLVNADAERMASNLEATIFTHCVVHYIDLKKKTIHYNDRNAQQKKLKYRKLVLASGACPVRVDFPGNASDHILSINNLNDYSDLRSQLADGAQVAIIGGGIIGCEFANDLISSGHTVHVISRGRDPMANFLPPKIASELKNKFQFAGIKWHGETVVKSILKEVSGYQITLQTGHDVVEQKLEVDLIISAIGLKPNVQLAQDSGLSVNNGICVNRYLRSSDEHVFALGDCAEVEGFVLPYVMPLMQASKALGKTLADDETKVDYPVMPVIVKTPLYPIVACPPRLSIQGKWQEKVEPDGIISVFQDEQGRIYGFALSADKISLRGNYIKQINTLLPQD